MARNIPPRRPAPRPRKPALGIHQTRVVTVLGGDTEVSATQSSLVASAFAAQANGSTATTLTGTWKNAAGDPLAGKSWSLTFKNNALVSAGNSVVTVSDTTIPANTNVTVTFVIEDSDGIPFKTDFPTTAIVPSSTGTGNTFGAVTATSTVGTYTATFQSSVSEAKTISVTVCGLLVTDTASVTVTGGFAAADMAAWDFIGATDDIRSGPLHDGVNAAFLGSAQNAWEYSATGGPSGGTAATVTYPASEANQGNAFFIENGVRSASIPANTKRAYAAIWHKFETGADLGDPWKGFRFKTGISGQHSGTFNPNSRSFFWDALNSGLTYYTNVGSMPTAASAVGSWHHYEFEWDISDETGWYLYLRIWIDGVLYFDYTTTATAGQRATGAPRTALSLIQIEGYGTVNRLDSESTQLIGAGGLSTQRIGGY